MKKVNEIIVCKFGGVLQGFNLDHNGNFTAVVQTKNGDAIIENQLDLPVCTHQEIEGLKQGKPTTIVKFFNKDEYRPAIDVRLEQ